MMTSGKNNDFWYFLLRPYVDFCCRHSYRRVVFAGKENIPEDGAVIFAPNHCNALMDPLLILASGKGAAYFGARADIFNNRLFARILAFLKILPMIRIRDGFRNVVKNREVMLKIEKVLAQGIPFCMFCEGTHRTKHSLLKIGKGIFRIAFEASFKLGKQTKIYVVPVGIEYGDYFRYMSTALVQFGKPIEVTGPETDISGMTEAEIYDYHRSLLRERLSGLMTYIEDDGLYEAKWILTRVYNAGLSAGPEELFLSDKSFIEKIGKAIEADGQKGADLCRLALGFERDRLEGRFSIRSFGKEKPVIHALGTLLSAILLSPVLLLSAIVSAPMWIISEIIASRLEDKAFMNTARFAVKLAMTPVMCLIWALSAFYLLKFPYAVVAFIFCMHGYSLFYLCMEFMRTALSETRLLFNIEMRKRYADLKKKTEDFINF